MWTSFFLALAKMFGFAENAIPSDVIRNDNHVIRKPRIEGDEKKKILNQSYFYLIKEPNWGLSIETYVNYTYDTLDVEDRNELIELLTRKIKVYRARFSKMFPLRYEKIMKRINSTT